ncbi:hypothetical protein MMC28_002869 [Mycoblastus sanguinarius]|nr:hypothetical protein [Mycoblastus sanguinarius]
MLFLLALATSHITIDRQLTDVKASSKVTNARFQRPLFEMTDHEAHDAALTPESSEATAPRSSSGCLRNGVYIVPQLSAESPQTSKSVSNYEVDIDSASQRLRVSTAEDRQQDLNTIRIAASATSATRASSQSRPEQRDDASEEGARRPEKRRLHRPASETLAKIRKMSRNSLTEARAQIPTAQHSRLSGSQNLRQYGSPTLTTPLETLASWQVPYDSPDRVIEQFPHGSIPPKSVRAPQESPPPGDQPQSHPPMTVQVDPSTLMFPSLSPHSRNSQDEEVMAEKYLMPGAQGSHPKGLEQQDVGHEPMPTSSSGIYSSPKPTAIVADPSLQWPQPALLNQYEAHYDHAVVTPKVPESNKYAVNFYYDPSLQWPQPALLNQYEAHYDHTVVTPKIAESNNYAANFYYDPY